MRFVYPGTPLPLGVSFHEGRWNFAIATPHVVSQLVLGDYETGRITEFIDLDPSINRTGNVWHIAVESHEERLLYGYKVCHTKRHNSPIVVDPYAKLLRTGNSWGDNAWKNVLMGDGIPVCVAYRQQAFQWGDRPKISNNQRVIYETHVRGLTQHPTSGSRHPGTFLGMIEKLDALQSLGVTTLELLPIFEWDETEWRQINPKTQKPLCNYWGYSSLSFFCPMQRYGTTADPMRTAHEFKEFVQACHDRNLEVVLDVVYNHTGEGNQHGPAYSYKILDQEAYYIMEPEHHAFANYSGCGNTFNANHPLTSELILASLQHWVLEYHVDGFRFDLASALSRNQAGAPMSEPSVLELIAKDPILSEKILIAEPWDAAGLYHTGALYHLNQKKEPLFSEWNDRYRDDVRQFINGTPGKAGLFATRLCGSTDLYGHNLKSTINFITAHDGFSLADLVSYNHKHNLENGEHNRDGANANYSWNCGHEGLTSKQSVLELRYRQTINFLSALLLSQGVPMILMGDECHQSKGGNNNAWCQDSEENWLNWEEVPKHPMLHRLIATLCRLRGKSDCFHLKRSLTSDAIQWHGTAEHAPDWSHDSHLVCCTLCDTKKCPRLFLAFNTGHQAIDVPVPWASEVAWETVVNTSNPHHEQVFELGTGHKMTHSSVKMKKYSCIVLYAPRHPL